MSLTDVGAIAGVIACAILLIGIVYGLIRGGFSLFSKINKIDNVEKGVNALLILHSDEIIADYKDQIKIVFNPNSNLHLEKEELLSKLESGYLTSTEARRLSEILRYEEAEAKRKDNQRAALAIGGLILLLALLSKE